MTKGEDFRDRFHQLAPVNFDIADWPITLPPNLDQLLEAVEQTDEIFWKQISAQFDRAQLLKKAEGDEELKDLILFNYGPYERLNDDSPFLPVAPQYPGLSFYPQNLTREDFTAYVQAHPESRSALESPYTVIRQAGSGLEAIPYHDIYRSEINRLSSLLRQASKLEPNVGFRQYLEQRAADLLTDDYYQSDKLWVSLEDNQIDLVVGPYEVYEDRLMGLKASYEAVLLVRDFHESMEIRQIEQEIRELCHALEPELKKSLHFEDSRVRLSVARLLYAGGEARISTPAIAFNLPNDVSVIEEVGSRQIILMNVLEAKFHHVAWPVLLKLFPDTRASQDVTLREFFNQTVFHEISHSIGPQRIYINGLQSSVNRCLKQYYSVLEEAKADTLATCFILATKGTVNEYSFAENYVSGLIRAIRFGLGSAHGGSNTIQLNFLLRENAIAIEDNEIIIHNQAADLRQATLKLTAKIIDIQENGDFAGAKRFVESYCRVTDEIRNLLERVSDVPTDIRIEYTNSLSTVSRVNARQ